MVLSCGRLDQLHGINRVVLLCTVQGDEDGGFFTNYVVARTYRCEGNLAVLVYMLVAVVGCHAGGSLSSNRFGFTTTRLQSTHG